MNGDLARFRKSLRDIRLFLPLVIVFCLINYGLATTFLNEVLLRKPNQVPGSLGAPFGGIIIFGILAIYFFTGLAGLIIGLIAQGRTWILALLGFTCMTGVIAYPILRVEVESKLNLDPEYVKRGSLVGEWRDHLYFLKLYENDRFELTANTINKLTRDASTTSGSWSVGGSMLYLIDENGQEAAAINITMLDSNYFLTYDLPEDFDTWDGYLGLMKVL